MLRTILIAAILFLSPLAASAQIGGPIQVSPQGPIVGGSAKFIWGSLPTADLYLLYVEDSTGVLYQTWHSVTETNCATGTGNCSFTPPITFSENLTSWWVLAWDGTNISQFSTGLTFFVGAPNIESATKINQTVQINGTHLHFGVDPSVNFGGAVLTVLSKDSNGNQVTAQLPPNVLNGSYPLQLTTPNGKALVHMTIGVQGPQGAAGPVGATGPTGPIGPQGIPGPSGSGITAGNVTQTYGPPVLWNLPGTIGSSSHQNIVAQAFCPAGEFLISGGCESSVGNGNIPKLEQSYGQIGLGSWTCKAVVTSASIGGMTANAICVKP